jgi:glycosyltransferase involved in cell wall biosynthesis
MAGPRFTVFTAIFNRLALAERTYRSLCAQTVRDFEWLIVDDGSTDDVPAQCRQWQASAPFPVRYIVQRHRGKHHAFNRAVESAAGELFTVLDSDDTIVPGAIERLLFHWDSIAATERPRYSGVTCLCVDQDGRSVGKPFPRDVLDCRHFEAESRFGATGEKWGCHRTEILRQFPYPDLCEEAFCPDALVWNRISRQYLMRHVNEPLRVFYTSDVTITSRNREYLMGSPAYASLYYRECLQLDTPLWWKSKRAINYVRYSLHAGIKPARVIADSAEPALTAALALAGCAFYVSDWLRIRGDA